MKRVYDFQGIIQGVGFRPCICRLAQAHDVSGWIQNRSGSVRAEFRGNSEQIDQVLAHLQAAPPPLARIDSIEILSEEPCDETHSDFRIIEGLAEDSRNVMIPADVAMCPDCRREVTNPDDRRFRYPFTTCVNCGPRYTVISGMPYDRARTTMSDFPLCAECDAEYTDPANRRFHAETTCCPACGPRLTILSDSGFRSQVSGLTLPFALTRKSIAEGKIAAIKGIGGFLLAIDPRSSKAVTDLRDRKHRPHKPLAVMARSIDCIKAVFAISEDEEQLLLSPQAPIVVLNTARCQDPGFDLAAISPDTATLGLMLPTSPLHMLLFEPGGDDPTPSFDFLVMTSGNRRSEPICLTTNEAIERLDGIADIILTHNRRIALRNDDSLCIANSSGPQVWRRARGFSPAPVHLSASLTNTILGMGAEIKNTLAVGYANEVVLSPHIGDLETPEAIEHMHLVADALPAFLGKELQAVAVDLNPDMHSSVAGRKIAEAHGIPCIEIQHHEAHAYACLAENGADTGFALTFDGTGLGTDDTIWGAELFYIDSGTCERLATYRPAPLPGGDSAVIHPVRQLVGRMIQCDADVSSDTLLSLGVSPEELAVWSQQCKQSINCPQSSGAGRLFDSIAALLGCAPETITYEGQPAIRLEALAQRGTGKADIIFQSNERAGLLEIDWTPFFGAIRNVAAFRQNAEEYAMAFHQAVINSAVAMIEYGRSRYGSDTVALSGGVLMNRIIHEGLTDRLSGMRLKPLTHSHTPPNDGCISLGQIIKASTLLGSN